MTDEICALIAQYMSEGETRENAEWMARRTIEAKKAFATLHELSGEPREITCGNYERAQKRLHKRVDTFMGISS